MNKMTLFFLTLALASLACMESTIEISATPAPTNTAGLTQSDEPASGAVFDLETWNTPAPNRCAIITAARSLHLRQAPNEQAAVVDYLMAGEQVTLESAVGDWWKIATADGASGYSKADYLQIVTCQ